MGFLDVQRQEAVSAELAKRQNERARADLESARQPIGPLMVLTTMNSPPTAANGRSIDRNRRAVKMVHYLAAGQSFQRL
jgi:hypothetical protein